MENKIVQENQTDLKVDFQQLFKESPIAFYTCDKDGYLTFFNDAASRLWGRVPELHKDLWCGSWKIYHPNGKPMPLSESPMARTLLEGRAYDNEEITIEKPDRTYRNLLVFPRPILDQNQQMIGAHNTLVDITEQKMSQIKQATLAGIVESSDDAIISKDLNGTITSWNSGAENMFGYKEQEVVGKSINILIPEARLKEETTIINRVRKGEKVDHFETIRKDKYNNEIPISITVSPVKDSSGIIIGASKVARDISDRLEGEEKKAVLSAIVESSNDAIISKNLNGTITSWNAGAEKIFGYKEEEVVGKNITILIPEARIEEENLIISNIKQGNRLNHFETIRKAKDGTEIPISLTVSPIKNNSGEIVGASKIARDITSQVQSKAEIQKYTRNLEILNSIGKSISENLDIKSILQRVTDATTKLTGASLGAFFYNNAEQGESFMFTLSGAPREAFEGLGNPRHSAIFRPTFAGQEVIRAADISKDPRYGQNHPHNGLPKGHPPVKSYLAVPVVSKSKQVMGGLFFGHPEAGKFTVEHESMVVNIAAQAAISLDNSKLFEQVKTLSEKKDEFIALVSHELKTPLTTIKGYLQVLSNTEREQMVELFLKKSLHQVNKLNTLVEDLLHMSRIEAGQLEFNLETFDLREMLLDISETFHYSYKTHKLLSELGDHPVIVKGDKQRIEQAIFNLISNAVKYSPKAEKVYLNLEVKDAKAIVRVKDEGIGLSEDQQNLIFTRFYRTENNKGIAGLGLGLYLTKQIIDRHNGEIKVRSKFGEGSEFLFTLPICITKSIPIQTA